MNRYPQNHVLLKFISQPEEGDKLKYLHDFLNGNLYMNTLSYFWNEYKPRDNEGKAGLATDPETVPREIPDRLPNDQRDLLEGTIGVIPSENSKLGKVLGEHLLTDPICRAKGFGYCNTLCFYKLDYCSFLTARDQAITWRISPSMHTFGQYVIIVKNEQELIRRIAGKVEREKFKFVCGDVNYKAVRNSALLREKHSIMLKARMEFDLDDLKDKIISKRDCFDKEDIYKDQNEWRVALYRGVKSTDAYTLKVGNLRDICDWVHVENLDKYLDRMFTSKVKQGLCGYSGNVSRKELRELFYDLGDNKAELFGVIG